MRMTSLPASECNSSSFDRLDGRIRRWIWAEGWTALGDAQEHAVPALIDGDRDVIIAAATASGKTEAAFFPILTNLLQDESDLGAVLYISPLKALINDQWGRLEGLCEQLEIPVVAWHGDISSSRKQRFLKHPKGVLLITPESLEAMFVTRGSAVSSTLARVRYIVVDELHAFIGSERGKQLQSLMHRAEKVLGRTVPRVGLSATLGDMSMAAEFLRPGRKDQVELIVSKGGSQELKVLIKGYIDTPPKAEQDESLEPPELEDLVKGGALEVSEHLFKALRGSNNLVFPNSRRNVELYADLLRRRCEREGLPNEFWAHHGSLAKELREEAEQALKQGDAPATVICTTTLELGIDIGAVKSIAQIGPPPSVGSLRQRLGRSGRRKGEPAILRCYCIEDELDTNASLSDLLREGLVQSIAMVRLLLSGWFEAPRAEGIHASTMVQQILSIIAERGGATAASLWSMLVNGGPFEGLPREDFVDLLRTLGEKQLLMQDATGLILHGETGERMVNHYEFYASFVTEEEYRIVCDGKTLGTLPISQPLSLDQQIIFGGRRWRVLEVDSVHKSVVVRKDVGGAPPKFDGAGAWVHDRVRQEMRQILRETEPVPFADSTAARLLTEARSCYARANLDQTRLIESGPDSILMTWHGDWTNDALVLLLRYVGLRAVNEGLSVRVLKADHEEVVQGLERVVDIEHNDPTELLGGVENLQQEKWDWSLPERLLRESYASLRLDFETALQVSKTLSSQVAC